MQTDKGSMLVSPNELGSTKILLTRCVVPCHTIRRSNNVCKGAFTMYVCYMWGRRSAKSMQKQIEKYLTLNVRSIFTMLNTAIPPNFNHVSSNVDRSSYYCQVKELEKDVLNFYFTNTNCSKFPPDDQCYLQQAQ